MNFKRYLWTYNGYTFTMLLLMFCSVFSLVLLYLGLGCPFWQFNVLGWTGVVMLLFCGFGFAFIFKPFRDSVGQFSLQNYCQIWVNDLQLRKTTQKNRRYQNIDKDSIFTIFPEKKKVELTVENDERLAEEDKERLKKLFVRIEEILKDVKLKRRKEPYFIVLTEKEVLLANEYFTVRTQRYLGWGLERVFIANSKDVSEDAGLIISNTTLPKQKLGQPFLLRDLATGLVYVLRQLRNSTDNVAVNGIEETVQQLRKSLAREKIAVDLARPPRQWVLSLESSTSPKIGLTENRNLIYAIILSVTAIIITLILVLAL